MTCELCAGRVSANNTTGVCVRNTVCAVENKRRIRERENASYANGKRFTYLERTYGLTRDQFESLLTSQGNVCAICGGIPEGKGRCGQWNVDHNHATGVVRGILCWSCNSTLGYGKDSPEVLRACAEYLERSRA